MRLRNPSATRAPVSFPAGAAVATAPAQGTPQLRRLARHLMRTRTEEFGRMWKRYNPKSFLSEPQKIAAALDARSLPWRVSDVMKSKIGSVDQDAELGTAAGLMRDDNVGLLPVVDADRRVVGCITDRDLVVRNPAPESLVQIKDVMSTDVACVTMDQSLDDVLDIMAARKVRRVPVVDGVRHLLGAVSVSDVIERSQNDKSLQKALARLSEPHN